MDPLSSREHFNEADVETMLQSGPLLPQDREHLESCAECRGLVARLVLARGVGAMKAPDDEMRRGESCPHEEIWTRIHLGIEPSDSARAALDHAVQCDHCGHLLSLAANILDGDLTEAEDALYRSLGRDTAAHRASLAHRLSQSKPATRGRPSRAWWWAAAAAACVLLAVAGVTWLRPPNPELLLAEAYSQHRTVELRLPGARFSPLRLDRGPAPSSRLDRPPQATDAEALAARALERNPSDPRWLLVRARSEWLDWNYDAALKTLGRVLELRPAMTDAWLDCAIAHYQKGVAEERPSEFGIAIEYLSRILEAQPNDAVALYNRALVLERAMLFDQAQRDWEAYLRLDAAGPWTAEARAHLAELKKKSPPSGAARP